MKLAPTYLTQNRHGTFYFRMVIPASLRSLVNGKREVLRSLKTDSEKLALKRARQQHAVRFDSSALFAPPAAPHLFNQGSIH